MKTLIIVSNEPGSELISSLTVLGQMVTVHLDKLKVEDVEHTLDDLQFKLVSSNSDVSYRVSLIFDKLNSRLDYFVDEISKLPFPFHEHLDDFMLVNTILNINIPANTTDFDTLTASLFHIQDPNNANKQ